MRQSFPVFCVAFSVALIPPFWRCRRSDRSHPSSAHRCIGGRAGFDLAHPVPQWLPQIFKPEVPEHCILHGTLDAIRTGQHRFKLTFTQVPCVLPLLRLFPFSILLKEVCDLLWHRYLLTIVDDNDVVVHLCPFRFRRKGTHPRCRYSAKNCRPSWSILRTEVVIMPYGVHECLRPHLRCGPHRKAARFGFSLLSV